MNEEIKRINYFRIAEDDFGLRLLYQVSVGGSEYIYEHDYVYNMLIDKYKEKQCWKDYRYYHNSNNIPKDAVKFVREI